MKSAFSQQVSGVSPEHTRTALSPPKQAKTMVEQEQIFPELKPYGMGEDSVDREAYQKRLNHEHERMMRYQIRVTETHTRFHMNGQLVKSHVDRQVSPMVRSPTITDNFNMHSAQAQDMKTLDMSY